MDSLIYYGAADIARDPARALAQRTRQRWSLPSPRARRFLMAFWHVGKLFPRADRSPVMVPHACRHPGPRHRAGPGARSAGSSRGFYISDCLEYRP